MPRPRSRPFVYEREHHRTIYLGLYFIGGVIDCAGRLGCRWKGMRRARRDWPRMGSCSRGLPPLRPARGPRQLYLHALTRQAAKFPASHNNTENYSAPPAVPPGKRETFDTMRVQYFLNVLHGEI